MPKPPPRQAARRGGEGREERASTPADFHQVQAVQAVQARIAGDLPGEVHVGGQVLVDLVHASDRLGLVWKTDTSRSGACPNLIPARLRLACQRNRARAVHIAEPSTAQKHVAVWHRERRRVWVHLLRLHRAHRSPGGSKEHRRGDGGIGGGDGGGRRR
eukprot:CAMPEP_0177444890 /NCGR_PEP_ID=MMETSP0369-20130122/6247_1 /TAXON_ID=447022 ORGANISM="Scrippsiella hangoei-like, Strain SHHI-4" /NCGR_SAMPLE_ID=MMETSP0369 /ASSEMBLY_ACC=CAM_ASM_000364 /LENGTH=158 /DNA_ID=CAMNT_0018916989 /DNA_START=65 /DNA_END=539 /DNA_ORIENTATION=-